MATALRANRLSFENIESLSTPRRLAIIVSGLCHGQTAMAKKVKGPPADTGFDENGKPQASALGFANKHGVSVDSLDKEEIGGTTYLMANLVIEGKSTKQVLSEITPKVILQVTGERLMRWGTSDMKFLRPIRWLVSLLDEEIVNFTLDGIAVGRETMGHRILAPSKIPISKASAYASELRNAYVIVDPIERKQIIEEQVTKLAQSLQGKPKKLAGPLLSEVVNITEWPYAIGGEFSKEYLHLPSALIETIMVHHQRYFPVESNEPAGHRDVDLTSANRLLPYFITVSNNDRASAIQTIRQGNERVLQARLADGRFFYFDDQKIKLSERKSALAQLAFQQGLGSYLDKVERLSKLSVLVSRSLQLPPRQAICLERTAQLCKLDLVTNLVRELPELQGYVGSWYAEREGEPDDVVKAIASHYSPRSNDDSIPQDAVGKLCSIIDKLDNLVGLFALGKKPSGSSDPYALRRQAQGIVDIIMDGLSEYSIDLTSLIESLLVWFKPFLEKTKAKLSPGNVASDLSEYLSQRIRGKLIDRGFNRDVVEAAIATKDPLLNMNDVLIRSQCLQKLISNADGLTLVRAGVRVGNILERNSSEIFDESLFTEQVEKELFQAFKQHVVANESLFSDLNGALTVEQYSLLIEHLRELVSPINKFFDGVMINDVDQSKRNNRHGLLSRIDRYFKSIADFPKLQPLLL